MEIRKVIIYITRDGVLHTSQERARRHAQRARKAQAESARTIEKLFKTARVTSEAAASDDPVGATFTSGTHKERILAAIKAGHKKTSDIKRVTGIKSNVLYADLAKLRSERIITQTNRLKTTRKTPKSKRGRTSKTTA